MDQIDRIQMQLDQISDAVAAEVAAGLIAHEIRNLLTPAVAYTQMALRESNQPPSTRRALEQSACAMRRACEVAELILASYQPAPSEPSSHCSDVASVINECIASLAWNDKNAVQLDVRVPTRLRAAIRPDSLRHVVLNLLLNAKAALPATGGNLTIGAELSDRSTWNATPAELIITIRDDGKGISPDALREIRTALTTGSRPQRHRPHRGLGLLLCQRLLRACGGALTLDSLENGGTVATVRIPASSASNSRTAAA